MSTKATSQRQPLSEKAYALLGHLVTLADRQGEVAITRKMLAQALRVSLPTVSRALKELRNAGKLMVVEEGGGRGQPTRYRITALTRDPVRVSRGSGGGYPVSPAVPASTRPQKRYQHDLVQEPDLDSDGMQSAAFELGEALVAGTIGFLRGAGRAWKGIPFWGRLVLAGVPLGTAGGLIGKSQGGRIGALIGGGTGILAGALLAGLPLSRSEAPPQHSPAPFTSQITESLLDGVDPISAAIGKLHAEP